MQRLDGSVMLSEPCQRWRAMNARSSAQNVRGTSDATTGSKARRLGRTRAKRACGRTHKKESCFAYSWVHHRPRSGNSRRLQPVTARLHRSLCQFFAAFLIRTVSPSLTVVW